MPYRLEPGETISSGVRRLLLEQVDQIINNLTDPGQDRDRGVHEARKNCKRVRAAYRLIRDEIGLELYRHENIRFRDTARLLAGARDSWVLIQTLDKIVAPHIDSLPRETFGGIQQKLTDQYETTLVRELRNQETIPVILESMDEARLQIENLSIKHEDFSAFRRGVRRVYARGRRAMQLAYAKPSAEIFHEWRKRVKYLWHQIEILEPIWPQLLSRLGDELHLLSDYLGDDHDLSVLRSMALSSSAGFENEGELLTLVRLIDQERLGLEAIARPLGERLYFDPSKTFTRRLETYWNAWKSEAQKSQDRLIQEIQNRSPGYLRSDKDFLTTSEMAVRLKISPEKVRRLIHDQKLPAEKVGAIWIIKSDIDADSDSFENVFLSTRQAADRLNLPLEEIRKMIRLGLLPATKMGRSWIIREADLANLSVHTI